MEKSEEAPFWTVVFVIRMAACPSVEDCHSVRAGSGLRDVVCVAISRVVRGACHAYEELLDRGEVERPPFLPRPSFGTSSLLSLVESPAPDLRTPAGARTAEAGEDLPYQFGILSITYDGFANPTQTSPRRGAQTVIMRVKYAAIARSK